MQFGIQNIIFLMVLGIAFYFFARSFNTIRRNIKLGRSIYRSDEPGRRWAMLGRVALGQSKMVKHRALAGFFHLLIYAGFILINIEILEIIIDGIFGTHRIFAKPFGFVYDGAISFFEVMAVLVILSCLFFLWRRNITGPWRVRDIKGWPRRDGNYILLIEIALMAALLVMSTAEANFEASTAGPWLVSGMLAPMFSGLSQDALINIERVAWWVHIIGILLFLNYLPISKHFHIIMAFPNVWYARLRPKSELNNLESVKSEVEKMMDPSADPYAAPTEGEEAEPERFGAKDVTDLNWVQLMNAYACTECGRCTASCPAHITGKKLSPRKIMMDTRDRLEEVGKNIDANGGEFKEDGKSLLDDYISREELWACTTCQACVEECPVNIDPLSIIMDMRRYLVMEESSASQQINAMMTNVENNGAPWAYPAADRGNWIDEIKDKPAS